MGTKGPRGAMHVPEVKKMNQLAEEAAELFSVEKRKIAFVFSVPPSDSQFDAAVLIRECTVEYLYKNGGAWVNWNYEE